MKVSGEAMEERIEMEETVPEIPKSGETEDMRPMDGLMGEVADGESLVASATLDRAGKGLYASSLSYLILAGLLVVILTAVAYLFRH